MHAEDADDEAMVELAIALSLQEQAGGAALAIQGIQEGLQALENMHHHGHQHHEPLPLNLDHAEASPPNEEQDNDRVGVPGGNEGIKATLYGMAFFSLSLCLT